MAIVLGFGLVFAVLITLFLIPSLYLILLYDIQSLALRKRRSWRGKKEVQIAAGILGNAKMFLTNDLDFEEIEGIRVYNSVTLVGISNKSSANYERK